MVKASHVFSEVVCKMIYGIYGSMWISGYKRPNNIQSIKEKVWLYLAKHNFDFLTLQFCLCRLPSLFSIYNSLFLNI